MLILARSARIDRAVNRSDRSKEGRRQEWHCFCAALASSCAALGIRYGVWQQKKKKRIGVLLAAGAGLMLQLRNSLARTIMWWLALINKAFFCNACAGRVTVSLSHGTV